MSTCLNAVSCPCDELFQVTNPESVTNLSGLAWEMPITDTNPPFSWPGSNGGCDSPIVVSSGLAGAPNQLYDVELLFRGIVELGVYSGGVVIGSTGSRMVHGGAYVNDGHNLYKLIISDPPAVYFLNGWNGVEPYAPCYLVRYSATVQIRTGAVLTLYADAINGGEITNFGPVKILTVLPGEPSISVMQNPYYDQYGQFLQVNVTSITPA